MKKQILEAVLSMALAVSCFTACGDSSTTESSKNSSKTENSSSVSESLSESNFSSESIAESDSQADSSSQESAEKKKVKKQTSDEVLLKVEGYGSDGKKVGGYTVYKYELDPKTGNYIRREYEAKAPTFEEIEQDWLYEYDKDLRKVSYDRRLGNGVLETSTIYKYEFDEVGNVIKESEVDPKNAFTVLSYKKYEYDDDGNCIKEEQYVGGRMKVSIVREYSNGIITKESRLDGNGNVKSISEFDEKGHVVKESNGTYTYEYYDDGGYKQISAKGGYKIYNSKEQLIESQAGKGEFVYKYTYGKIS
ncbi:MAG: hypothetical protein ILA24_07710 [Ruminococcus sp.]|nr:hypothetical protein [Ruminococcus sp.]